MIKILYGKVQGRTVELDEDPCMVDGHGVEILVKVVSTQKQWAKA